jgi:hypothetical protein
MDGKKVNVVVKLNDTNPEPTKKLVEKLKKHGFELNESLDAIGVLTGSVGEGAVSKLGKVKGVMSVEQESTDYRTQ